MPTGRILITGGTGFLGRGILRQASREGWDAEFTVLSRDELKQAQCRARYPGVRYVLGDVTDTQQLANLMIGHDIVIHAAALKYIPEGEFNAYECVRINVDGARSVISAARAANVRRVVGISTDKAAQPVNTYGMTKAIMERLFAEATNPEVPYPIFTTCRYGNVIGSTGSVVPVMMDQYLRTRKVRITDPNMTRFWMSVDDAVDTIEEAISASAQAGTVTVPKPRAASMVDIAYAVLAVCGEKVFPEVPASESVSHVEIIGKRPGEKMHEDLVSHYELFRTVETSRYMQIRPPGFEDYATERPTLSSDKVPTIDRYDLCAMIEDSLHV